MHKFSVVIPLYNKSNYIQPTILSVLKQTVQDFEIIVVDDGSVDDSPLLVEQLKDSRIKLIRQKNLGVSAARNRGINTAQNQYIAFLDADDYWQCNFLATISRMITLYPQAGAYATGYTMNYGHKTVIPKFKGIPSGSWEGLIPNYYYIATSAHSPLCMSNLVLPRVIFHEIGFFNEQDRVGEDLDLCFRLGRQYQIAYNTRLCSVYNRLSENNARVIQKVWYPSGYFSSLTESLTDQNISSADRQYIAYLYEKKYIAYLFSLIMSGQYKLARKLLYRRRNTVCLLLKGLTFALSLLPASAIKWLHNIRMKVY